MLCVCDALHWRKKLFRGAELVTTGPRTTPIDYAAYRAAASITCTSPSRSPRSPRHPLPRRRPRVPGEPSSISVARATGPWLLGDARLGTVASQCTRRRGRLRPRGRDPEDGTLEAGFVTASSNQLFAKTITGGSYVFPAEARALPAETGRSARRRCPADHAETAAAADRQC